MAPSRPNRPEPRVTSERLEDAGAVATAAPPSKNGAAQRPRVAYLVSRFPKITETFVLYEMRALEELGVEIEVFSLREGPAGPRHPEAAAYERRAHYPPFFSPRVLAANARRFLRGPRLYLRTWWEVVSGTFGSWNFFLGALGYFPKCVVLADRVETLRVDHVHAHFASHPALAAFVVHRLTGVPYSFTAHGSDLHVERRMLAAKVYAAEFVVAVSAYNRELICEECGDAARAKVVVIHCGADPDVFGQASGDAPPEAGRDGAFRIVCVASLEEVKGHIYLLRACRLLHERGIDVRCDLVGGGPLRGEIEHQVKELGLEGRVHLHGPVPRPRVREILAEADVAVLASYPTASGRREGIPVALMEAMMSRLPVVASGLSGIPELVEDGRTGFLVPPGDAESLAERLECLAGAPPLRRRLGEAGRERVTSQFDQREGARLLLRHIASSS